MHSRKRRRATMNRALLAFVGLTAAAASDYVPTPRLNSRAARANLQTTTARRSAVASGSRVEARAGGGAVVTHPNGSVRVIAAWDDKGGARPMFERSAMADAKVNTADDDLPADYDGWLEYTAFNDAAGFDSFDGYFSIPDMPASAPEVLYLFTGLQNIDWIPKVDKEPTAPFDIIQPVLQYPGDGGNYWSVKSWYVTLDAGAFASDELKVSVGDAIWGVMERQTGTGPDAWTISSAAKSAPAVATALNVSYARLASQPWAYCTLECYGCQDCTTYPTKPTMFTEMVIKRGATTITPKWLANPKPAQDRKCHESVAIKSASAVTISFQ